MSFASIFWGRFCSVLVPISDCHLPTTNNKNQVHSFNNNQHSNNIPSSPTSQSSNLYSLPTSRIHFLRDHPIPTVTMPSLRYGYCTTCCRYVPVYTRRSHHHHHGRRHHSSCTFCTRRQRCYRHIRYRSSTSYHRSTGYYPFSWCYPNAPRPGSGGDGRFRILPIND